MNTISTLPNAAEGAFGSVDIVFNPNTFHHLRPTEMFIHSLGYKSLGHIFFNIISTKDFITSNNT